jgi:hypothetical protein
MQLSEFRLTATSVEPEEVFKALETVDFHYSFHCLTLSITFGDRLKNMSMISAVDSLFT